VLLLCVLFHLIKSLCLAAPAVPNNQQRAAFSLFAPRSRTHRQHILPQHDVPFCSFMFRQQTSPIVQWADMEL
jgi:hypothetical protein